MIFPSRSTRIGLPVLALAICVAFATAGFMLAPNDAEVGESPAESAKSGELIGGNEPSDAPILQSPVAASVIAAPLIRAGLEAEAFAAVGVAPTSIPQVLMEAVEEWQANPDRLPQADASYAALRQVTDALHRKIRSGQASNDEVTQFHAQMEALESAKAEREAALAALRDAALEGLSVPQAQKIVQIRENDEHDWAPMRFKVVALEPQSWLTLRDALLNERTSAKYGEEMDPTLGTALSDFESMPAVAAAKSSCDSTLSACQASWNSFLGIDQ